MNLPVPYRKQLTESSCFPACIRMVLKYYGDDIDEHWLWKKGIIPPHPGTWDVTLAPQLHKKGYKTISYWNGRIDGWSETVPRETREQYKKIYAREKKKGIFIHRRNATLNLINSYLSRNIPLLAEVNADTFYKKKCGWTHMIVIIGRTRTQYTIHDPDKHIGRKNKKVSIHHFKKSWEHLSPKAGRSLFIIEPKQKV